MQRMRTGSDDDGENSALRTILLWKKASTAPSTLYNTGASRTGRKCTHLRNSRSREHKTGGGGCTVIFFSIYGMMSSRERWRTESTASLILENTALAASAR